jgi:hypothetical protein
MDYQIIKQDCIEWMNSQPEKSIECIITSPPYNLDIKYGKYQDDLPRDSYLKWIRDIAVAMKRVLKDDGMVLITCPDLQSVCAHVAQGELASPLYQSPAGPIAALDILYGHRPAMAAGNLYMAHRCGFTQKVLTATLQAAGFATIAAKRRGHPYYDLWALATVSAMPESELRELAQEHFQ